MANLILRTVRGTPLTNLEVDNNFISLNTAKAETVSPVFTGNVGIGTATPAWKLHVSGVSNLGGFLSNSLSTFAYIDVGRTATDARMGVVAAPNELLNGSAAGDGLFYVPTSAKAIYGTAGAGAVVFMSNNAERMRIDASGNVGIGTTSPASYGKFVVVGTGDIANFEVNTGAAGILLLENGTGRARIRTLNGSAGMAFLANTLEAMRIDSVGGVRLGRTSALSGTGEKFTVDENSTGFAQYMIQRNNSGYGLAIQAQNNIYFYATGGTLVGSIGNNGTSTTYNTTSDARLKINIAPANPAGALLDAVQVRQFDWRSDNSHQRYGFIAQELIETVPEAVYQPINSAEMMAVDYSKLVPLLVKEVQSLRARVATLEIT